MGICSSSCTSGIYFSITSLLIGNPARGFMYLMVYNAMMFVLPLIAILAIAANRRVVDNIERAEKAGHRAVSLLAGLAMLAIGGYILPMALM